LDWILVLLTTHTYDSEVQVITAPLLLSTTLKSPQHPLRLPTCCVFTSRSLVAASTSGDSSAFALKPTLNGGSLPMDFFLHSLPYRTGYQLNKLNVQIKVNLLLAVYRQSDRLDVKPLRPTTRNFFNRTLAVIVVM
jgi:hypothetical protein